MEGFPFAPLAQVLHCGHSGQGTKKEDSEDPRSPDHVRLQSQVLQLLLYLIKLRTDLINNVLIDPSLRLVLMLLVRGPVGGGGVHFASLWFTSW